MLQFSRQLLCLASVLLLFLLLSCSEKKVDFAGAQMCLKTSRSLLTQNHIVEAKAMIDTLRSLYPMALNEREEGILLLDSIDLREARMQLDSLNRKLKRPDLTRIERDSLEFDQDEIRQKVRFFLKKIEYDKARKQTH